MLFNIKDSNLTNIYCLTPKEKTDCIVLAIQQLGSVMLKSEINLENIRIENVFSNLIIDVFNHETTIKNIKYRVDVSGFKDPK